jgi:hypothetical protein
MQKKQQYNINILIKKKKIIMNNIMIKNFLKKKYYFRFFKDYEINNFLILFKKTNKQLAFDKYNLFKRLNVRTLYPKNIY